MTKVVNGIRNARAETQAEKVIVKQCASAVPAYMICHQYLLGYGEDGLW